MNNVHLATECIDVLIGCGVKPKNYSDIPKENPYSLPWHVALVREGESLPFCAGTLISRRHVLTSANCIFVTFGKFDVIIGEHFLPSNGYGTRHQICRVNHHTKQNWTDRGYLIQTNYDFAIVHLTREVLLGPRAVPACLPDSSLSGNYLSGKTLIASGWGKPHGYKYSIAPGTTIPNNLQKVAVHGLTNAECILAHAKNTLNDPILCAGSIPKIPQIPPGIAFCADVQGNSGGIEIS